MEEKRARVPRGAGTIRAEGQVGDERGGARREAARRCGALLRSMKAYCTLLLLRAAEEGKCYVRGAEVWSE